MLVSFNSSLDGSIKNGYDGFQEASSSSHVDDGDDDVGDVDDGSGDNDDTNKLDLIKES